MTHAIRRPFAMSTFVRFIARVAAFFGFLFGLFGLLWSTLGQHVFLRFGPLYVEGIPAGILGVAVMPVAFALGGALIAVLVYLPIRLLVWLLWK